MFIQLTSVFTLTNDLKSNRSFGVEFAFGLFSAEETRRHAPAMQWIRLCAMDHLSRHGKSINPLANG